jgi:hypothetical protein
LTIGGRLADALSALGRGDAFALRALIEAAEEAAVLLCGEAAEEAATG